MRAIHIKKSLFTVAQVFLHFINRKKCWYYCVSKTLTNKIFTAETSFSYFSV